MAECEICEVELTEFEEYFYKKRCLYHCDKSDTATIKWSDHNNEHVKRFWSHIRKRMVQATDKLDFSGYQFPAFEFQVPAKGCGGAMTISKTANFWELPEDTLLVEIKFDKEVDFTNAIFRYKANFESVSFNENVCFKNAKFYGWTRFSSTVFDKEVNFSEVEFLDEVLFNGAIFKSEYCFSSCIFNDKVTFDSLLSYDDNRFGKTIFKGDTTILITQESPMLTFKDITFTGRLSLLGIKNGSIVFDGITFNSFVTMEIVGIINSIKLDNVTLSDKAIFGIKDTKCKIFIYENVKNVAGRFELVNFEILDFFIVKNSSLRNTDFIGLDISKSKNVIDNVSFAGAHFANVKWGEINESRFVSNNNKRLDRQMARQLKSINDAQGETVIANDFYALEMRLRSKELKWDTGKNEEKLIQNIHGLISNHSNDWLLPSIWFFVFGFLFTAFAKDIIPAIIVSSIPVGMVASIYFADKLPTRHYKTLALAALAVSYLLFLGSDSNWEFFAALVNPLNLKDSKDLLLNTNLFLVYTCRLIEIFISYQIITAIRKNTRRK